MGLNGKYKERPRNRRPNLGGDFGLLSRVATLTLSWKEKLEPLKVWKPSWKLEGVPGFPHKTIGSKGKPWRDVSLTNTVVVCQGKNAAPAKSHVLTHTKSMAQPVASYSTPRQTTDMVLGKLEWILPGSLACRTWHLETAA